MPVCTPYGSIRICKMCALNLCFNQALCADCCWNIELLFACIVDSFSSCFCFVIPLAEHELEPPSIFTLLDRLLATCGLYAPVGCWVSLPSPTSMDAWTSQHFPVGWPRETSACALGASFGLWSAAGILTGLIQFASGYSVTLRLHPYRRLT